MQKNIKMLQEKEIINSDCKFTETDAENCESKDSFIIENQEKAIEILNNKISDIEKNTIYIHNKYNTNILNSKDTISSNSEKIKSLIAKLSSLTPTQKNIKFINKTEGLKDSEHLMFPNLKFDSSFLDLLGLRDLVMLGTWGRYKVIIPKKDKIIPKQNKHKTLLIMHCNIHNNNTRKKILNYSIEKYMPILRKYGIIDYFIYSANSILTQHDIRYAHPIHKRHSHWSPYSSAEFANNVYERFPNSIVLTHPYIASLLLDNGINLNYDYSLCIDNKKSVIMSFSNIAKWAKNYL